MDDQTKKSSEARVKVIVRVRPVIKGDSGGICVTVDPPNFVLLKNLNYKNNESLRYKFDSCYDSTISQTELFEKEVKPILKNVFNGLNTTIFAYGVTGAGKTHTMQGTESDPGVIPRSAEHLLSLLKLPEYSNAELSMSYLEIYNEKVYDLLQPKDQDLPIREDQNRNIFIPNLGEVPIKSLESFKSTYEHGCNNRTTAATKLNSKSSRSHAIVVLKVVRREAKRILTGKLHLIDLAGSEDNRRTDNHGARLKESTNINLSLSVLNKVVVSLNKGLARIPYRDSKLTRLLQDSLGGNSYSVMFTNIAPGHGFFLDTYNTLNFASKSKKIVNSLSVNEQSTETRVVDMHEEEYRKQLELWKKRKYEAERAGEMSKASRVLTNKENIKDIENSLRTQIQEELRKEVMVMRQEVQAAKLEMKKELLSPWIKKHNILDNTTLSRLERLEKKLLEQAEDSIRQELTTIMPDPKPRPGEGTTITNIELMTPNAKMKSAKECIVRAKALEKEGDLRESLNEWIQAALLLPTNEKIKKRIQHLQSELLLLTNEVPPFTPSASNWNKSNGSLTSSYYSDTASTTSSGGRKLEFNDEDENGNNTSPDVVLIGEKKNTKKKKLRDSNADDEQFNDDEYAPSRKSRNSKPKDSLESRVESEPLDKESAMKLTAKILQILNSGTKKELMKLSGIGAKRAQAILEYDRASHPFTSLEDLKNVGVGKALLQNFLEKNSHLLVE